MSNCKVGDIAVVIDSDFSDNIGRLVSVVAPGPDGDWLICSAGSPMRWWSNRFYGDASSELCAEGYADDCDLRPIRGQGGSDETLTWAPRPEQVPA